MPTISVHYASLADSDAIRALQIAVPGGKLDEQTLSHAVRSENCFIAKQNGTVVGFALVERWFFGRRFLSLLAVHPDFRRSGIATKLIRYAALVSAEGLFTSTNRSNAAAQRLFGKLGFEPSGIVENLDKDDPELVYYRKSTS
jgi:ribosomal protein S18 acetylase RimI-like enzyme